MKKPIEILRNIIILLALFLVGGCVLLTAEKQQMVNTLKSKARNTMTRVQDKLANNPQSAVQDSLSVLDSILDYTDAVKSNPDKFSPEKLEAYIHKINIINENIDRFSDLTLQTDVSFALGQYKLSHLSEKGKQEGDKLIADIIASLKELSAKYPGKNTKIIIKITGYTDAAPFISGSRLEKEILTELGHSAPKKPSRRRAKYNEILSKLRAATISSYIVQRLLEKIPDSEMTSIEPKIIGHGETLPAKKEKHAYQPIDFRRRICIVSPFIEVIP
ncbi:MAG: hypothetical protein GY862_28065 [Gammaproteobacteria bacterium]|nr:hypothetical protein [Gammaproteobacteria bacterium]